MTSIYEAETNVFRKAVQTGLINPIPPSLSRFISGQFNLFVPLMDHALKLKQQTLSASWAHRQSTWQLPQTRRYQQSRSPSDGPVLHPDDNAFRPWIVELARWPVPFGSIGVVKSFEQYLAIDHIQTMDVYSISTNWGNPFSQVDGVWWLRLSPIERDSDPWFNVAGVSAVTQYLPGIPYSDCDRVPHLWFPAGSPSAQNVHFPIPGGKVLRLFFQCGTLDERIQVAGRFCGSVQSEICGEAQFMARTTW